MRYFDDTGKLAETTKVRVTFGDDVEMGAVPPLRANGKKNQAADSDESQRSLNSTSSTSTSASSATRRIFKLQSHMSNLVTLLVLSLGAATSAALLSFGIISAMSTQDAVFTRSAKDTVFRIQDAFEDYVNAASLVHNRCRHRNFTRQDFSEIYQYIIASGLQFKAVQFDPNITHDERPAAEAEARAYYAANYPQVDYQGFRGFNYPNSTSLKPRTNQSFYFPIHYQEPTPGNEAAIGLDYWSSESRIRAVQALFENEKPSMTDRLSLVKKAGSVSRCGDHNGPSFGVVLMHPGIQLVGVQQDVWPKDFSSIVLCIPDLLRRATLEGQAKPSILHIHDRSQPFADAVFMGGARAEPNEELIFVDEIELDELEAHAGSLFYQEDVHAANRVWTISIEAVPGTYKANVGFVIMGGVLILLASICLVVWIKTSHRRMRNLNQVRAEAESEKATLILDSARQTAQAERELNDFLAHEVRNPVAAAMAACSFAKVALNKTNALTDEAALEQTRDDINIIDYALKFVNDLLRNMLDMHRASNNQLEVNKRPTDLLHDVLEPVSGMLYQRGNKIKLLVECPDGLFVMADELRLKQIMINLGRNSSKFVEKGFIRFKAEVVDGNVRLYVDDSGCGIPTVKRQRLFAKFQSSLDLLNQGTGIGLYLCKLLVQLMEGSIFLDDDYDSGIPGSPGTRFVVDLKSPPLEQHPLSEESIEFGKTEEGTITLGNPLSHVSMDKLPETLSVLFVDDDAILRRLFGRSLKRLVPGWTVREAANGETAVRLVESGEQFDLIFMDMYMASVEKQLLGTETVALLRENGVMGQICGLSANDKEAEFYDAGADAFVIKPFPCEKKALTRELCRVLAAKGRARRGDP